MQLIGLLLFKHYRKEALEPYLKILCSRFGFCVLYFLLASQISLTRALDLAKSLVSNLKKTYNVVQSLLGNLENWCTDQFYPHLSFKKPSYFKGILALCKFHYLRFFKTFQKYLAHAFFGLIILWYKQNI